MRRRWAAGPIELPGSALDMGAVATTISPEVLDTIDQWLRVRYGKEITWTRPS